MNTYQVNEIKIEHKMAIITLDHNQYALAGIPNRSFFTEDIVNKRENSDIFVVMTAEEIERLVKKDFAHVHTILVSGNTGAEKMLKEELMGKFKTVVKLQ